MLRDKKGFTLIELVLVIAILGVLAVTALPNIFNVSIDTARANARDAVAASIQTGLSLYAAKKLSEGNAESYPPTLDAAAAGHDATRDAPLFLEVLQGGVTRDWTKVDDNNYTYTGGGASDPYVYDSTEGTFIYTP